MAEPGGTKDGVRDLTICLQCALEEFVVSGDPARAREASTFHQSPVEHMRSHHPDPEATRKRRRQLEQLFAQRMGGAMLYPVPTDNH